MSEKPIIMSGTSVRAILSGNKTQTRRVVKPQPKRVKTVRFHPFPSRETSVIEDWKIPKARYAVGDRPWVRETWRPDAFTEHGDVIVRYRANDEVKLFLNLDGGALPDVEEWAEREWALFTDRAIAAGVPRDTHGLFDLDATDWKPPWKSPIFMPKWATRIWLEVTGVRVERVQDIAPDDVTAEGLPYREDTDEFPIGRSPSLHSGWHWGIPQRQWDGTTGYTCYTKDHKIAFKELWDSLNAKYPWADNPWVWVYEFKRSA